MNELYNSIEDIPVTSSSYLLYSNSILVITFSSGQHTFTRRKLTWQMKDLVKEIKGTRHRDYAKVIEIMKRNSPKRRKNLLFLRKTSIFL